MHEWVPAAIAADVSRADAERTGIWATLQRQGHRIETVRQTITAAVSTEPEVELLGVPAGTPLLLVRRVALGADGTPLALSDHRYLAHRFSLEVEFRGWSSAASAEPPGLRSTADRRTRTDRRTAPTALDLHRPAHRHRRRTTDEAARHRRGRLHRLELRAAHRPRPGRTGRSGCWTR